MGMELALWSHFEGYHIETKPQIAFPELFFQYLYDKMV
jgi:hypothetical protein